MTSPGYVILLTRNKASTVWVCSRSHRFEDYSKYDKALPFKGFKMGEVVIDKRSVFIGHGNAQNAGFGCKEDHALQYYTYPVPESSDLMMQVRLCTVTRCSSEAGKFVN